MMRAQICPICNGRGEVPESFYDILPYYTSGSTEIDRKTACRSCHGAGYVVVPDG